MASPTARSLALLRSEARVVSVCERWIAQARCRVDLWGFCDICGYRADEPGVTAYQVTTAAHLADRETKVRALPQVVEFLRAGNRIELHGWAKRGPRGKRKLWMVERRSVTL